MNIIAPMWDGNENWLLLGGGGLLAAFPLAYGVILSALYAPIIAMLLALIFRGVAFEFRWRDPAHQGLADAFFTADRCERPAGLWAAGCHLAEPQGRGRAAEAGRPNNLVAGGRDPGGHRTGQFGDAVFGGRLFRSLAEFPQHLVGGASSGSAGHRQPGFCAQLEKRYQAVNWHLFY